MQRKKTLLGNSGGSHLCEVASPTESPDWSQEVVLGTHASRPGEEGLGPWRAGTGAVKSRRTECGLPPLGQLRLPRGNAPTQVLPEGPESQPAHCQAHTFLPPTGLKASPKAAFTADNAGEVTVESTHPPTNQLLFRRL